MTTTTASTQLRQLEHPQLQEHQVWYNDQQHLLIVDSVVIDCTPSEYDVLLLLLRAAGEPISWVVSDGQHDRQAPLHLVPRHRAARLVLEPGAQQPDPRQVLRLPDLEPIGVGGLTRQPIAGTKCRGTSKWLDSTQKTQIEQIGADVSS